MAVEIDHIKITPDKFGWMLHVYDDEGREILPLAIGDAIQFHDEVERTIGRWLADGPADFHGTVDSTEPKRWHERAYPFGNLIDDKEETDHGR
jgi:hypothetical protein